MYRLLIHFSALLMLLFGCTAVCGQLVQVGPGYVKAPFVRVHKLADGSSFVRAPFVSVHSPSRAPHQHHAPHEELHRMSWDSICLFTCQATDELTNQLATFPTGAYWQQHLAIQDLHHLLHGRTATLSAAEHRRLEEIRHIYDAVHSTPELSAIVRLRGFQRVHLAIHELLLTPEQRQRRELCAAATYLSDSLSRLKESDHWHDFLDLGFTFPADVPPAIEQIVSAQRRYESLHNDDVIAQLPGFQETREALRLYLEGRTRELPTAEELPPAEPTPDAEGDVADGN